MTTKKHFNQLLNKEDVDVIFHLEEEIAAGSFGTVYRGRHLPTGRVLAIKIITPEEDEVPEDLMIEIAALKACKHKNIVEFFGGYRKGDEIFIALELCNCSVRDIFEYSDEPLLEKEIALITRETLKGLDYMHKNNMIHRDIKGANILLTDSGEVKLVDFGVSSLNAKKAKTFVGTPYWMAPEIIESKNTLSGYGPEIDIWALGITLIELAETSPPLSYINPMRALFQIPARPSPTLEKKNRWSAVFQDFIAKCLEKNPKRRPSAQELMQHPFIRDCDPNPQVLVNLIKRKQRYEKGNFQPVAEEQPIPSYNPSPLPNFSDLPNLNALPDLNALPTLNSPLPNLNPSLNSPLPNLNPALPNLNPALPSLNPSLPSLNPSLPSLNPSLPSLNPSLPNLNPSLPDLNPSLPDLNNSPKSGPQKKLSFENKNNLVSSSPNVAPMLAQTGASTANLFGVTKTQSSSPRDSWKAPSRSKSTSNLSCSSPSLKSKSITHDSDNNNNNNNNNNGCKLVPKQSLFDDDDDPIASGDLLMSGEFPNSNGSPNMDESDSFSPPLRQKSTLKRPPPSHREGGKNQQSQQNKAINKRIIKEQMGQQRLLQKRLQKKVERLEKDQQMERDKFLAVAKRFIDNSEKKMDTQKKSVERQFKTDQEGLLRFQQKEQRNMLKHHEGESKAHLKDIKDQTKVATKSHLDNQKLRQKEQKNELRDAKKSLSKNEMKTLEKQHKVELQINDLFFQKSLDRTKIIKDNEIAWTQQKDHHKTKHTELLQNQQMEVDSLKQQFGTEVESHNEIYSIKHEELSKIQPMIVRHMNELHDMQRQNLQQLLELEKSQQMNLLLNDQRAQQKDYREKKKRMEKEFLLESKQLEKKGLNKMELKNLQVDNRNRFNEKQAVSDKEFEDLLNQQKQEEETQLDEHQKMQQDYLINKQKEEISDLQVEHTRQLSELNAEEALERQKMLNMHLLKMRELVEKHHKEQSDLLDIHHQEQLMGMKRTQKSFIDLIENQRKEILNFVALNVDKLLPNTQGVFNNQIDTHFDEVIASVTRDHQNAQRELSAEMEAQVSELAGQQQINIANLEEFASKQIELSVFNPVSVTLV